MWMCEASDAGSVEGLQSLCHGNGFQQRSFRVAVTGVRMPRLNFFVGGAILIYTFEDFEAFTHKSLKRIGILRSIVWSTCHF